MKKIFAIILLTFLLSCNNKKEIINREHSSKIDCKCFKGIGSNEKSNPIYTFSFSDNNSVSLCGYAENGILSEFNIFDCKTGKSLTEYGAVENCTVTFRNNKLDIIELVNLPNNNDWKWVNTNIGIQTISVKNKSLICSIQKPLKVESKISIETQNKFLDLFESKQIHLETDEILARLEILSILGNKRAYKFLTDIEKNPDYIIDGAYAEQYHEALARIKWLDKSNH